MSKILLINGSSHEKGCTYTALSEIADALAKNDVESELLYLGTKPMAGCIACGKCFQTGRCVFDDKVNEVLEKLDEYDGIVVGSPVYYAGPTGQLCAFLDRLNKYFGISNMHVVGSRYWNQVHGFTPEDVRKDEEGLQTMRSLAQNMAWLLKNVQVGKAQGVQPPEYEERINTNFIG